MEQALDDPEEPTQVRPVSVEELTELNGTLDNLLSKFKGEVEEHAIFNILKNLERMEITKQHLVHSKVGKTMTRIIEFKHDFPNKPIKAKATNLVNVWKKQMDLQKAKKKVQDEKKEELQRKNDEVVNAKLPWVPQDLREDIYKLGENDKIALKFIEIIQKHP